MAASALVHLSVLTGIVLFAEVHPFGSVTAETIAVDIVSPDEVKPVADQAEDPPPPKPSSDAFNLSMKSGASGASAADASPSQRPSRSQPQAQPEAQQPPQQAATARPEKQAALTPPHADPQPAAVQLPSPPPSPAPPPAPSTPTSTTPVYVPPQPDLSIKYHVMLGLPPDLPQVPPEGQSRDNSGDGFDAPALKEADLAPTFVAAFRSHLKTCSKLPASIAASDNLRIKLRVFMTPGGRLAAAPILTEASASAKGPLLMQSAIGALEACQPYDMLPVDRYGEWKELDLSFAPQDFTPAS